MRRLIPSIASLSSLLLLAACGDLVSLGGGGGSGGEGTTTTTGSGGWGTTTGSGGWGTTTGAGGQPEPLDAGIPDCTGADPAQDADLDGYAVGAGDCNDCDPKINPGAVEVATGPGEVPLDEDCSGQIDDVVPSCDDNLAVDDADPVNAAKAVDLCKLAAGPADWGLVSAAWVLPDGAPAPALAAYDLGHGIVPDFGPNVTARKGARMLALSSGAARRPGDPGYSSPQGLAKGYQSNHPQGFPKESPACPNVTTGTPNDGAALEVTVRVPLNAGGFAFDFDYFTYEFPNFVCSPFNDMFVALLSPPPAGHPDGDISFDSQGNTVSVNSVFLEVCGCQGGPPCQAGGKLFTCGFGTSELLGTGFGVDTEAEDHGSTSWLTTSAPATPGGTITVRWTVYDSGDGVLDTTTVVDNWRWVVSANVPLKTARPQEF
ncbi:MAG: putative metal-binding motif-containing protein [Polyangiaceae bacterium]|nr:putative metal-binding motif-containing protein [Polyangiaceae bacterium]